MGIPVLRLRHYEIEFEIVSPGCRKITFYLLFQSMMCWDFEILKELGLQYLIYLDEIEMWCIKHYY